MGQLIDIDKAIKVAADGFIKQVVELSGVKVKYFETSRLLQSWTNEKDMDDEICITIKYRDNS